MSDPKYCVILYVESTTVSADFYTQLLGRPPIEVSPGFALFVLASGVTFGMWAKHAVEPTAVLKGGGAEMALSLDNNDEVDTYYAIWKQRGIKIVQSPTKMDFGYTFVAQDPDEHRIRVFAPSQP